MERYKICAIYKQLIILVFIQFGQIGTAQVNGYAIESFQDAYQELEEYNSIYIETEGDILFDYEFVLDFDFPFFDSTYTRLIFDQSSWGSFTDEIDEALLLLNFSGGYTFYVVQDTSNLQSDVRFTHVEEDGMQAFVIQFTDVFLLFDQFENEYGTSLNFQLWLWEDGIIETHFGEMFIGENPRYRPEVGFFCASDGGGIDTTEICGPHMGISHPLNPDIAIGLQGAYNDYEVTDDVYSILTVLPPEGWIIRFVPTSVSTEDPRHAIQTITLTPNPATAYVQLPSYEGRVIVSNASGQVILQGDVQNGWLDIADYPSGLYLVQLTSKTGMFVGRFVKE